MQAHGYMNEVEWDGATLTARGTNKTSHLTLRGTDKVTMPDDYAGPVRLRRDEIATVTLKKATLLVNGRVTVKTTDGREYRLHFRKGKQEAPFAELAAALGAVPA